MYDCEDPIGTIICVAGAAANTLVPKVGATSAKLVTLLREVH